MVNKFTYIKNFRLQRMGEVANGLLLTLMLILSVGLIATTFHINGLRTLVVESGSMEPAVDTGSVVIVSPQRQYQVGDIITYVSKGSTGATVTHRIIGVEVVDSKQVFIAKGDANEERDSNKIEAEQILGKVQFTIPLYGYFVSFAKSELGYFTLVFVATLFIIQESSSIKKEIKLIK